MSKINIDDSLCTGCGLCASNCPDIFEISDDNIARVVADKSVKCDVKEIIEQCPVSAISVQ
ncbi:MAG: ferredoxin [Candidatus Omnitrophota bacterium]|nr:ferredoxin [Candidatus Omnitrophota bacterium]